MATVHKGPKASLTPAPYSDSVGQVGILSYPDYPSQLRKLRQGR